MFRSPVAGVSFVEAGVFCVAACGSSLESPPKAIVPATAPPARTSTASTANRISRERFMTTDGSFQLTHEGRLSLGDADARVQVAQQAGALRVVRPRTSTARGVGARRAAASCLPTSRRVAGARGVALELRQAAADVAGRGRRLVAAAPLQRETDRKGGNDHHADDEHPARS